MSAPLPGSWCRCRRLGTLRNSLGPLSVNHLGQITAVTISFNLKQDVPLGDAVAAVEKEAKGSAGLHHDRFPGYRPGLPGLHQGAGAAADHRHPGDLHRPGHAVRKLHPPADDPLRPAVGRLRRPDHPADLRQGPEPVLLRRHHHAGRDRQEERHHDDRLRPGGAAP